MYKCIICNKKIDVEKQPYYMIKTDTGKLYRAHKSCFSKPGAEEKIKKLNKNISPIPEAEAVEIGMGLAKEYAPAVKKEIKKRLSQKNKNPAQTDLKTAIETYKKFHAREPKKVNKINIPETSELVQLGELTAIGYKSTKWTGKSAEYMHEFQRNKPILATDKNGEYLYVIGRVRITDRGIEDYRETKKKSKKNPAPGTIEETKNYIVEELRNSKEYDPRSFRYVERGKNRILIGCKKGYWQPRKKHCKKGTEAIHILKPKN